MATSTEEHFTAVLEVSKTVKKEILTSMTRSGYERDRAGANEGPRDSRNAVEISRIVVRSNSYERLMEKLKKHVAVLEDGGE